MRRKPPPSDDLTVLNCWACEGSGTKCQKCARTGKLFWVDGRAYPYTPEGEQRARESLVEVVPCTSISTLAPRKRR